MTAAAPARKRRTQAERTAETREALLEAAIGLLYRNGYSKTPIELIAEEAGVTRGAMRHHFRTRAQLMAAVICTVYEQEHRSYREIAASRGSAAVLSDWPDMLWAVLSKPSGLAVLEVLQASRSDPELAALVMPMQAQIEQMSFEAIKEQFGSDDEAETRAAIRLFVWAVRGLSIAQVLTPNPADTRRSIDFLKMLIEGATKAGLVDAQGRPGPARRTD